MCVCRKKSNTLDIISDEGVKQSSSKYPVSYRIFVTY